MASTVNRIKTTTKISPMLDEYYASMAHFDCVAWCMGPSGYELMNGAGVSCFQAESSSARIAGGQAATPFIEYGQARGVSPDMCSYAKINLGLVLAELDERWDMIDERYRLNPPDLVVAGNICPSMMQWAHVLGQIYHVPVFILDYPFCYDSDLDVLRDNAKYIREQLENLKEFLLKCSGQKEFRGETLMNQMAACREMDFYQQNIGEMLRTVPAPASFIDNAFSMTPAISMKNEKAANFYKEFMEEMIERVKTGTSSISNERYRIMWRGNFPWFKIGFLSRLLAKYDALLVSGCYGTHIHQDSPANRLIPPDGFDLKDPIWGMACFGLGGGYVSNYEDKWKSEFVSQIENFSIDAVIIQAPHTCRPWTLTSRELCQRVEDTYGIPCIVLEADHTDPAYFNDAQVETRIKALLETVDARREEKARKAAAETDEFDF